MKPPSPSDDTILDDLLARWEASQKAGVELESAEDLCRDHPHLLERLRNAIAGLKKADGVLADGQGTIPDAAASSTGFSSRPQAVGPYRILEVLGQGGMGTVYKAEQRTPLKRIVAVKVIKLGFDSNEVIRVEHSPKSGSARMRVVFLGEPMDETPLKSVPDDESLGAAWVNLDELENYALRGEEVRELFEYVAAGGAVFPAHILQPEGMPYLPAP